MNKKAAEALADPLEYKNLFPDFDNALAMETQVRARAGAARRPAVEFASVGAEEGSVPSLTEDIGAMRVASPEPVAEEPAFVEPTPEPVFEEPTPEPAPEPEPEPVAEPVPEPTPAPEPVEAPVSEEPAAEAGEDDDDWGLTD